MSGQKGRTARQECACACCGKLIEIGEPIMVISLVGYSIAPAHPACREQWVRERRNAQAFQKR